MSGDRSGSLLSLLGSPGELETAALELETPALQSLGLHLAALSNFAQGDVEGGRRTLEQAAGIERACGHLQLALHSSHQGELRSLRGRTHLSPAGRRGPVCGVARRRYTAAGMTPPRSLHPDPRRSGGLRWVLPRRLVAHGGGDLNRAAAYYEETLATVRKLRNMQGIALVCRSLGEIRLWRGDPRSAAVLWCASRDALRKLRLPDAGALEAWIAFLAAEAHGASSGPGAPPDAAPSL